MEQDLPFGVVVDALGDYAASLGSDRLERLIGGSGRGAGAGRAGASRGSAAGVRVGCTTSAIRTHRAVRALLEALGAGSRVVLALDDVHWADDASLELIGHLLRRPAAPRGNARPGLPAGACAPRPGRRARPGHARRGLVWLSLGALTRVEADRLLEDDLPQRARSALFDESGGNPFYLQELARGW